MALFHLDPIEAHLVKPFSMPVSHIEQKGRPFCCSYSSLHSWSKIQPTQLKQKAINLEPLKATSTRRGSAMNPFSFPDGSALANGQLNREPRSRLRWPCAPGKREGEKESSTNAMVLVVDSWLSWAQIDCPPFTLLLLCCFVPGRNR